MLTFHMEEWPPDYEQSFGSDSQCSDVLVDSECELSDEDDILFDGHVDQEVEWEGIDRGNSTTNLSQLSTARGGGVVKSSHPIFNPKIDLENPKFELGMLFPDIQVFRQAVRNHSIRQGRLLKFTINFSYKVQAKCTHKSCPWVIYASKVQKEDSVIVKTYNGRHRCPRKEKIFHANPRWIADHYKDKLLSDPKWPVDSMMTIMQKEVGVIFSKWQMYQAKKIVSKIGVGADSEQFAMLWSYAEEIRRSNPGTTIKIKSKMCDGKPVFRRLYLCWGSLKKGFLEGCRPVIFLDGCHLKSSSGGILLTAVGVDGNNCLFPFAYAVVEKETKKSWLWFIGMLIEDLNIVNSYGWTKMSDKQKGLVDAIDTLLPNAEQRFCVQHLYANFKSSFKGLALRALLWKAARATKVADFTAAMKELHARNKEAFEWLVKKPPSQWSKSHFSFHSKCDMLLNNMCESFNSVILRARGKPILEMLEIIRLILMKRTYMKRDQMRSHTGDLCPKIEKVLEELKKKSMQFIAHWNGKDEFEIEGCTGRFKVHLGLKTCTCRRWELTGIPCEHAISGMFFMNKSPEEYVDDYYKKETVVQSYSYMMGTLNPSDLWPSVDVDPLIPPPHANMPGRPKKNARKKQIGELVVNPKNKKVQLSMSRKGRVMTCSFCKKNNHNLRGCPMRKAQQPADPAPEIPAAHEDGHKIKRGRKRKSPVQAQEPTQISQSIGYESSNTPSRVTRSQSKGTPSRVTRSQSNDTPSRVTRGQSKGTPSRVTRGQSKGTTPTKMSDGTSEISTKSSRVLGLTKSKPQLTKQQVRRPLWTPSGSRPQTEGATFSSKGQQSENVEILGSIYVDI